MTPRISILFTAMAVLGAVACGKVSFGPDPSAHPKRRVEMVLNGIRDAGTETGSVIQTAICKWEKDVLLIRDYHELEAAMDAFDRWRRQASIYPTFESFEIIDAVPATTDKDPTGTYYVRVKIDGALHRIRVPPKQRMSWAEERSEP